MFVNERFKLATKGGFIFLPQMALTCFYFFVFGRNIMAKLQYFGHLMRRVDSLEKTLMLEGIGGRRRRGWQRMRWLYGITDLMDMSLSELRDWWWTGRPGVLWFIGSQRVRHDWVTDLNWTEISIAISLLFPKTQKVMWNLDSNANRFFEFREWN